MNGELMTTAQVADYLKLRPWTIRHWVSHKKIPYVKLGSAVRFRRRDIERFVLRNLHGKESGSNGNEHTN